MDRIREWNTPPVRAGLWGMLGLIALVALGLIHLLAVVAAFVMMYAWVSCAEAILDWEGEPDGEYH